MHRLPRILTYAVLAALPALGLTAGLSPAANASAATRPAFAQRGALGGRPLRPARAEALAIIKRLDIGRHRASHRVPGVADAVPIQVESNTWAGYANTGSDFTKVTGSWTEPDVTCPAGSSTAFVAFWVGLDGFSSDTVEQAGTLLECYDGVAYQYSWWEMYPTNDVQVVGESVAAGDSISDSVVRSGDSYTLKVTDSTHTANSFTTTQTCSGCANSSAEWVLEGPSGGPLADFGTWTLGDATATAGGTSGVICSTTCYEITMVDSEGHVMAQPTSLDGPASGFSVFWERST